MKKAKIPLNLILILPFLNDKNRTIGRTITGFFYFYQVSRERKEEDCSAVHYFLTWV